MINLNDPNDSLLKKKIDQIFLRYDVNKSGTLSLDELHIFLNDLLASTGNPRQVTYEEALNVLTVIDKNRDGRVNKYQLFMCFKFLTQPQIMQSQMMQTQMKKNPYEPAYNMKVDSYGGMHTMPMGQAMPQTMPQTMPQMMPQMMPQPMNQGNMIQNLGFNLNNWMGQQIPPSSGSFWNLFAGCGFHPW